MVDNQFLWMANDRTGIFPLYCLPVLRFRGLLHLNMEAPFSQHDLQPLMDLASKIPSSSFKTSGGNFQFNLLYQEVFPSACAEFTAHQEVSSNDIKG